MGVQDDTEKVLRALHVMLAKGEQYPKEPSKVIVDKQQMLDLLSASMHVSNAGEVRTDKKQSRQSRERFPQAGRHYYHGCQPQGRRYLCGFGNVYE